MKYKKVMLIALLLLAVLTIGAASAADDAASDDVAASDVEALDVAVADDAASDDLAVSEDEVEAVAESPDDALEGYGDNYIHVADIDKTREDYEDWNFTEIITFHNMNFFQISAGGKVVGTQNLWEYDKSYQDDDGYHYFFSLNDVNFLINKTEPGKDFYSIYEEDGYTFTFALGAADTVSYEEVYNVYLADDGISFVNVISSLDPTFEDADIHVANIQEGAAANVVITTNVSFSGNVTVQIGNKIYNVHVVNGKGTISISGLAAGTYTAKAIFAAGLFKDREISTKFTVAKKPVKQVVKLALKKVKVKRSAKKLVLTATLKINGKAVKGKIIKFKFNKKTYKAKTNKRGVAKVIIKKKVLKKLKKGKKITYQASYGKIVKRYKVKVKK